MKLELKKSELESYLLTISAIDPNTGKIVSGLLNENIKLSSKRKLQKIHKELLASYKELVEDMKAVKTECGEDKEKLEKEAEFLLNEIVKLDIQPVEMSSIEEISSTINYNFDIIEKIAN